MIPLMTTQVHQVYEVMAEAIGLPPLMADCMVLSIVGYCLFTLGSPAISWPW